MLTPPQNLSSIPSPFFRMLSNDAQDLLSIQVSYNHPAQQIQDEGLCIKQSNFCQIVSVTDVLPISFNCHFEVKQSECCLFVFVFQKAK